jgi:hypothetical protein
LVSGAVADSGYINSHANAHPAAVSQIRLPPLTLVRLWESLFRIRDGRPRQDVKSGVSNQKNTLLIALVLGVYEFEILALGW